MQPAKQLDRLQVGFEQPVNTLLPKPYLEELLVTEDAALRPTGVLGCSMCARL